MIVARTWQPTKARKTIPASHVVADRWKPRLQTRFRSAMQAQQQAVDLHALTSAVRSSDHSHAEHAVHLQGTAAALALVTQGQTDCYHQGGLLATSALDEQLHARKAQAALGFDIKNPRAVTWARRAGATLVTDVTDDGRAAIAELIAKGLEFGIDADATARMIRETIGLTERLAMAVFTYARDLEAAGRAADIGRLTDRYAAQLLNYRADMIARTETISAAVAGQLEAWEQAADAGYLDRNTTRKVWMITGDCCDDCADMEDEEAELGESFSSGDDGPPLHPMCRCAVSLSFTGIT